MATPPPPESPPLLPIAMDASPFKTLAQSIALILVSEIGDKTFLIAALLAMRHPRLLVFSGALTSLLLMSALSAELGHILPSFISRKWTQLAAAVLFLTFGFKMALEARNMKDDEANKKMEEGMKEAESEIAEDEDEAVPMQVLEEGRAEGIPTSSTTRSPHKKSKWVEGARNCSSLIFGPVMVQAFVLTFIGEWGDRSQFATIALGAAHNVYLVTLGTILGHACCTALAVIGGRYISTKISVKHVTWGGAALFLIFGVIYLYESITEWGNVDVPLNLEVNARL